MSWKPRIESNKTLPVDHYLWKVLFRLLSIDMTLKLFHSHYDITQCSLDRIHWKTINYCIWFILSSEWALNRLREYVSKNAEAPSPYCGGWWKLDKNLLWNSYSFSSVLSSGHRKQWNFISIASQTERLDCLFNSI